MKDDHNHDYGHNHDRRKFHHKQNLLLSFLTTTSSYAKPTSYIVLVISSFILGYFSATYRTNLPVADPPAFSQPSSTDNSLTTTANLQSSSDHFRFNTICADPVGPGSVRSIILDRIYDGISPYDNFPPAHVSGFLRPSRVKGWGSNGAVFENLIRKVRPRVIIEVGTFLGASAIHMSALSARFGIRPTILCLDDFRGWAGFREIRGLRDIPIVNGDVLMLYQFMQNVVSNGSVAAGSILPVPFSTGSGLEKLCELGVHGDLIEIDAGHDFHSAWADINRAYKILRPGGVIFGHDYFTMADNRGVRRAVNLFARVKGLRVRADGQHWVIDSD